MDNVSTHIGLASAVNGSLRMAFGAMITALFGSFYKGSSDTFFIFLSILSFTSLLLYFWALADIKKKKGNEWS